MRFQDKFNEGWINIYNIQKAKSSRAVCKNCNEKIDIEEWVGVLSKGCLCCKCACELYKKLIEREEKNIVKWREQIKN